MISNPNTIQRMRFAIEQRGAAIRDAKVAEALQERLPPSDGLKEILDKILDRRPQKR